MVLLCYVFFISLPPPSQFGKTALHEFSKVGLPLFTVMFVSYMLHKNNIQIKINCLQCYICCSSLGRGELVFQVSGGER